MQESWSYIKDSGDFLKNVRHFGQIPDGAIFVTADMAGLYPSIPRGDLINAKRLGYLLRTSYRWQNLSLKIIFLSSMGS